MKQNQNFDHNHSQKVLSCHYNFDFSTISAKFRNVIIFHMIFHVFYPIINDTYTLRLPATHRKHLEYLTLILPMLHNCYQASFEHLQDR